MPKSQESHLLRLDSKQLDGGEMGSSPSQANPGQLGAEGDAESAPGSIPGALPEEVGADTRSGG